MNSAIADLQGQLQEARKECTEFVIEEMNVRCFNEMIFEL